MKKIAFYPTAVLLGIIAFVLNTGGHEELLQASRHRAKRIEAAYEQHIKYTQDAEGIRLHHAGVVLSAVGLAFTLSGIGCMVAALVRREKGWYLILTGLLVSDILALMLL